MSTVIQELIENAEKGKLISATGLLSYDDLIRELKSKLEKEKQQIRFQKITQDIFTEIKRQDDKWGEDRDNHPLVWLSILQEEFGELAREINDADFKPFELSENYRTELVQIVAVGMQAIKNFDTFTVNLKTSTNE